VELGGIVANLTYQVGANYQVRACLSDLTKLLGYEAFNRKKHFDRVLDFFDRECAYCGKKEDLLQADHITGLNKDDIGLDCIGNIVPACASCNNAKGKNPISSRVSKKRRKRINEWMSQNNYPPEIFQQNPQIVKSISAKFNAIYQKTVDEWKILRLNLQEEFACSSNSPKKLRDVSGNIKVSKGKRRGKMIRNYDTEEAEITDPVLLIRINQLFKDDMTPEELYKVTRGVWKVDVNKAEKCKYVFAVYGGIIREVYEVHTWFPADTLENYWTPFQQKKVRGRYAFNGRRADDSIRKKYNGKSVEGIWSQGAQNPIKYITT